MERKNKKHIDIIEIDDKWISGDVLDELFACDIFKCKGACCVEGDLGAPVEESELPILEEIYEAVKPYMRPEGIKAVQDQGTSVRDFTGKFSTPLIKGKECAYVTFKKGIALCAIEQAHAEGKIDFQKPVSCHLYPIRVNSYKKIDRLNYDRWDICSAACSRGEAEGIPVYKFVKDALIRKFGEDFYLALEAIAEDREKEEM